MPFKSRKQVAWMFSREPEMAKRWAAHTPDFSKLPERVKKPKHYKDESSDKKSADTQPADPKPLAQAFGSWNTPGVAKGLSWSPTAKPDLEPAIGPGTAKPINTLRLFDARDQNFGLPGSIPPSNAVMTPHTAGLWRAHDQRLGYVENLLRPEGNVILATNNPEDRGVRAMRGLPTVSSAEPKPAPEPYFKFIQPVSPGYDRPPISGGGEGKSMTAVEQKKAFVLAFLSKCAAEGIMDPAEIAVEAEKLATVGDVFGKLTGTMALGGMLGLAAPTVAGYAGGRLMGAAGNAMDRDDEDSLKIRAEANAYRRRAAEARLGAQVRKIVASDPRKYVVLS